MILSIAGICFAGVAIYGALHLKVFHGLACFKNATKESTKKLRGKP
jgi:hypothetical protein